MVAGLVSRGATLAGHGAHGVLVALLVLLLIGTAQAQGCQVYKILRRLTSHPGNDTFVNITNHVVSPNEVHISTVRVASDWLRSGDSSFFSDDGSNSACLLHLELTPSALAGTPCAPTGAEDSNSWIVVHLHYGSTFIQADGPPFPYTAYYPWYPLGLSAASGVDSYQVQDLDGDPTALHLEIPSPSNTTAMSIEVWKPAGRDVSHFPDAMINVTLDVVLSCFTNITYAPCPTAPTVPWSSEEVNPKPGSNASPWNTSNGTICSGHGQCKPQNEAPTLPTGLQPSTCGCDEGYIGSDCRTKITTLVDDTTVVNVTLRRWSYYEILEVYPESMLRVSAELMSFPRYSMDVYGSPFLMCIQQFGAEEPLDLIHTHSSVQDVGNACDVVGAAAGRRTQFMVMQTGGYNGTGLRYVISLFGRDRASYRTDSIDGLFLQDQDLLEQKTSGAADDERKGNVFTPEIVSYFQVTLRYTTYPSSVKPEEISCPSPPGSNEPCGSGTCVDLTTNPDVKRNMAQDREYDAYNRNYGTTGWYGVKNVTSHCSCGAGTKGSDCSGNSLQLNASAEYETPFEHDELTVYVSDRSPRHLRVTMKPLACLAVWDPYHGLHRLVMPREASAKNPFNVQDWVPGATDPYAHYNTMLTASLDMDSYAYYRGRARIVRLMISRHFCVPSCWITANRTELQQSGFLFHPTVSVPGSECAPLESILAGAQTHPAEPDALPFPFHPKYSIKLHLTDAACSTFPCQPEPTRKSSSDWLWKAFLPVGGVFGMQVAIIALIYMRRRTCLSGGDPALPQGAATQATNADSAGTATHRPPSKWTSLPETIIQSFPTYTFQSPFTLTPHPRSTKLQENKDKASDPHTNQQDTISLPNTSKPTHAGAEGAQLQPSQVRHDTDTTLSQHAAILVTSVDDTTTQVCEGSPIASPVQRQVTATASGYAIMPHCVDSSYIHSVLPEAGMQSTRMSLSVALAGVETLRPSEDAATSSAARTLNAATTLDTGRTPNAGGTRTTGGTPNAAGTLADRFCEAGVRNVATGSTSDGADLRTSGVGGTSAADMEAANQTANMNGIVRRDQGKGSFDRKTYNAPADLSAMYTTREAADCAHGLQSMRRSLDAMTATNASRTPDIKGSYKRLYYTTDVGTFDQSVWHPNTASSPNNAGMLEEGRVDDIEGGRHANRDQNGGLTSAADAPAHVGPPPNTPQATAALPPYTPHDAGTEGSQSRPLRETLAWMSSHLGLGRVNPHVRPPAEVSVGVELPHMSARSPATASNNTSSHPSATSSVSQTQLPPHTQPRSESIIRPNSIDRPSASGLHSSAARSVSMVGNHTLSDSSASASASPTAAARPVSTVSTPAFQPPPAWATTSDLGPVYLDEHRGGQCCMICLEEYSDGDILMGLPCMHCFHSECIRGWLSNNATCPACRLELLPSDDASQSSTQEQPAPQP